MAAAASSSLLSHACDAPDESEDQELSIERSPITDGTPAPEISGVVALRARAVLCPAEPQPPFCSGQLLGPRVVVTSAHCVLGMRPSAVEVFLGDDARGAGPGLPVETIGIHPDYDVPTRAHDLALLTLNAPASPAPLEVLPYTEDAASVQLVGYGADVAEGAPGLKRAGMAAVEQVTPSLLRVGGATSLSCNADSGGAALIPVADRASASVGLIRSGDAGCSTFTVVVRLSPYLDDFIQPVLLAASLASPAPEPALTCDDACTSDESCQGGAVCLQTKNGPRCGFSELGPVEPSGTCASGSECRSNLCVSVSTEHGSAMCQCLTPCAEAPVPAPGCALAPHAPALPPALLLLCAARLAFRRSASRASPS